MPETPCDKDCTDGDGVIDHAPDCAYTPAIEGAPCKHEQGEHDETCGFEEPVAGSPCLHTHDEACGGLVDTTDNAYLPPETNECTCGAEPDADGVTVHSEDCPLYVAPEVPTPGLTEITALEGAPEAAQTATEGALEPLNLPDTLSAIYSIRGDTEIVEPDGEDVYSSVESPTAWDGLPSPAVKGEYSTAFGSSHIFEHLINAGAEVNYQNKQDTTPLHYAVLNNRTDNVVLLMNAGASISIRDENGDTALDIAKEEGYADIASVLTSPPHPPREGCGGGFITQLKVTIILDSGTIFVPLLSQLKKSHC